MSAPTKPRGADSARGDRELTLKAAAEMSGVSGKVLRRYIREGRLRPASMDGDKLTVTLSALREAGLVAGAAAPAPSPAVDRDDDEAEEQAAREQEAREKSEREAREKSEREARERSEREARERSEREAREKSEREAREKSERAAREKAEREAREKAAREKAEREKAEREKAERAAKERADREAREKAEREAREKAQREKSEREAREKAEREAREKSEREARERAERDARERAEREAREKAARAAAVKPQAVPEPPPEITEIEDELDDLPPSDDDDVTETVRLEPETARTEARVVTEVHAEAMPAERGLMVTGSGPWVTSNQLADLMRLLAAEREARAQQWMDRTETLYREMLDASRARVAQLEEEAKTLQSRLEDSLRMVPKGENLAALEQTIRDLRIELDRRDAARTELEHERDRLRDLTDRLRNDLSRSEKRNLEMAEQLRRFRAQGIFDRMIGREPDT